MGNHKSQTLETSRPLNTPWYRTWVSSTFDQTQFAMSNRNWPFTLDGTSVRRRAGGLERRGAVEFTGADNPPVNNPEMTVAEFIKLRFVPEYLASVGLAGYDYFHAILKHVLTPEQVDLTLGAGKGRSRSKLKTIPGWPYLDSHRLCDINTEHIQRIIGAAQEYGYSTQTVTHIRNVIRKVLCHALNVGCLYGENPAARAVLPRMDHKPSYVLTLEQLRQVIHNMQQAEREIALLCILTGMSIAEIFGLQWKYVNLSKIRRTVEGESIPPKVIAVRIQSYRSQIRLVSESRKRDLPISQLTSCILQSIETRRRKAPQDGFLFSSRNRTPINQDNLAARRLKIIGKRLDIPWLSWNVFHRTTTHLPPESLQQLQTELRNWIISGRQISGPHQ